MGLITGVRIENFRRFRSLTVNGLTRLSVIVGDNNSGKTSVLDAIEFLASGASPRRLWRALERHDARIEIVGEEDVFDATELFYGRKLEPTDPKAFYSEAAAVDAVIAVRDLSTNGARARATAFIITSGRNQPNEIWHLFCASGERSQPILNLSERRGISAAARKIARNGNLSDEQNVIFVPAGVPSARLIMTLWPRIAATELEDRVRGALELIDDRFVQIAPTTGQSVGYGGIFLRLKGTGRTTLSEWGDGTKRMVTMAVCLAAASQGVLLIDEISEGVHFSRIAPLLEYLVRTAATLQCQIVATTHSRDVIEAIAALHSQHSDVAKNISVHRLLPGAEETILLDAAATEFALEGEREVR